MKNLDKLGVQEMSTKEINETKGGLGYVCGGVALAIAILNTDWDQAFADYSRGFQDAHN
ncbi:MAG: hypothetical protein KKC03_02765 [Bacteroidetes bacterium]|nr:hypothetical protein [Bacteroidota bacterium]